MVDQRQRNRAKWKLKLLWSGPKGLQILSPSARKPCGLAAGLPAGQAGMRARGGMSRRSPQATEGTQKLRGMNKENNCLDTPCSWHRETSLAKFGNQLAKTLPLIWPRKFTGTWRLPVNLVTDQQIQELNARYRGLKRPTDVLTFSLQVKGVKFIEPPLKDKDLGEIYINYQQARRQAKELGQSYQQELRLLLIHGLLHLLGYDHRNTREQKLMTRREQELLLKTRVVKI